MKSVIKNFISFARNIYGDEFIPLHRPIFNGNERKYLIDCIDSNFVSSVGARVNEFEEKICDFTGSGYAVAVVNGTAALHTSLRLAGVEPGQEVITQALTFVATCNAIKYTGATPVFIDVDRDTLGLSPTALQHFLECKAERKAGVTYNRNTGKKISACVPMHTFGFPCKIQSIAEICSAWGIPLIEDAAESLGSFVGSQHTGRFSTMATLSFNGNKLITTGGGGMIITDNEELAKRAKHITTTAKISHDYEFIHDEVGYNYRMPNLNAALGCAQMEKISSMLKIKKLVADKWNKFFDERDIVFMKGDDQAKPNFWLNSIILKSKSERDLFLKLTNADGVMTRPIWRLMSELSMFKDCENDGLQNSRWLEDRVVNIPSSVPDNRFLD